MIDCESCLYVQQRITLSKNTEIRSFDYKDYDALSVLCTEGILEFLGKPTMKENECFYRSNHNVRYLFLYRCKTCGSILALDFQERSYLGAFDRYERRTGLFAPFLSEWKKTNW